ncbi:MAG: PorP/SprF family type IX secretion system membrane protein [Bacteroidetes bacterium]|nr:PorP/SprF family type IX secretion system membrane protein [Bacteroidota bacterium]MDF1863602.1 PorP/SprF family type IX secretion system membrane protein [Saprospiraceae bacterium]
MKNFILIIMLFLGFQIAHAQDQTAVFSHYHITPILISPAAAGFSESHQIQMNVRTQWVGFPGAPKTYGVSYNGPIGSTFGFGTGILSESIGNLTNFRYQMNFALRVKPRNTKFKGAFGFSTEFFRQRLANSVVENEFYEDGDEVIDQAIDGRRIFDASMGFWGSYGDARTDKGLTYFGLTFSNLIVAKVGDIATTGDNQGSFFKFVIFNVGHIFDVDAYNFKLEPSLMIRSLQNVPFQADFNIKGSFLEEKLVAGLSYRSGSGDAIGLLLGTKVSSFNLFYSYDVSFSRFQKYNSGSHEVTIAFDFKSGKKKYDRSRY